MTVEVLPQPVTSAEPSLNSLAQDIRREHESCLRVARTTVQHAINCGDALLAARKLVAHGTWERWLDENVPEVSVQARLYMRLASYRDAIPEGVVTLEEARGELRGLPAFDGTGPAKHSEETRQRALELIGQGLSRRMVAAMLNIERKSVNRWVEGLPSKKRPGSYRTGRPTRAEQKERARLVSREHERAIGPAALANGFRAVWEAHREGPSSALIEALRDLAASASEWADQINRKEGT